MLNDTNPQYVPLHFFFSFALGGIKTDFLLGKMGETTFFGVSDVGIPCVLDEFLWKGDINHFITTILFPACESKTDLCGIHRLS